MMQRTSRFSRRRPYSDRLLAAGLAVILAAVAAPVGAAAAEKARPARQVVDPVGNFVPIKPKVFKDLKFFEVTDYDRKRASNTGKPFALVLMKEGDSALEPLEFKLSGVWLDFAAKDAKGVVYRFKGTFQRTGDLYSQEESNAVALSGHLATYLGEELLRQENLHLKFRSGE